jgi:hypothetical protein
LVLPNSVFVLLIRDAENVPVFKHGFDGFGRDLWVIFGQKKAPCTGMELIYVNNKNQLFYIN